MCRLRRGQSEKKWPKFTYLVTNVLFLLSCALSVNQPTYRGQPNRRFFASRIPASRAWRELVIALPPHRHVRNAATRAPTRSGTAQNREAASSPSTRESRWCHSAYRRHAGRGCASARGPPVRYTAPCRHRRRWYSGSWHHRFHWTMPSLPVRSVAYIPADDAGERLRHWFADQTKRRLLRCMNPLWAWLSPQAWCPTRPLLGCCGVGLRAKSRFEPWPSTAARSPDRELRWHCKTPNLQ